MSDRTKIQIDQTDCDNIYIGEASFRASESNPVWRIKKIVTNGDIVKILLYQNYDFVGVWDDRATYTYE